MKSVADRFDLRGRVAVVTGASSGLGVAFAEGLAGAGAHLVLAARRKDRLDALIAALAEQGIEALAVRADVAREADVDALVAATRQRFGRVDVLVNNAGVANVAPAADESREAFTATLDVNLTGAFLCAQRFGRVMLEQGSGSIVNVASILGLVASGQIPEAAYCASKGGLVSLTRELAAQWARRGVRVNALCPGYFPSEMTADMFAEDDGLRFIRRRAPMGRGGDPDELVGPLLFLASDASSYVTGQALAVDGGWTIV
ncbi:MAG: glucose 1-dehydrogenase [Deltaproteobacteria bacterium]|nr:glucose 1-dehydrogenase [Deltaproteobacteria bacterium]